MKSMIPCLVLSALLFLPAGYAHGVTDRLSSQDVQEAVATGRRQGQNIAGYLNKRYGFSNDRGMKEHGVIRTKWFKLAMMSGLIANRGGQVTSGDYTWILNSAELQIDLHVYGNGPDFANDYSIKILQEGRDVEPVKTSVSDISCHPHEKPFASGFPIHCATIRAFFPNATLELQSPAEIVLRKGLDKVTFSVNFADFR